jgi:putative PIN family toxin of toxin-antitoxin system
MPPVVIDTNVLVSALMARGSVPHQIIGLIRNGALQMRYNDAILAEYRDVLSRPKFNFRAENIQKVVNGIIRAGIEVNAVFSAFFMPDESDRKFYDVAISADALLITGNKKHYPAEPFVLTPADFLIRADPR